MSVDGAVQTRDEVAIRNAVYSVIAAWADNDADAFADRHSPDATLVTVEGFYCKGREQIRETMRGLYATVFKGSKVFIEFEDVRFLSDDVAMVIYWNGILSGGLSELPREETRRATTVLAKHDGKWLVEAFQNVFITEPRLELIPQN